MTEHEQWLAERRKGIGASDIGVLSGTNVYQTEYSLWLDKKHGKTRPMTGFAKTVTDKGNDVEDIILRKGGDVLGLKFIKPSEPYTLLDDSKYFMCRANLDGLHPESGTIAECKFVSSMGTNNWALGVPQMYQDQVQYQMFVTGFRKAYVFALFDTDWTIQVYEVEYDEERAQELANMAAVFWNTYIIGDQEPAKLVQDEELLAMMDQDPSIFEANKEKFDAEADALIKRILENKQEIKKLEGATENLEARLHAVRGYFSAVKGHSFYSSVYRKPGNRTVDSAKLKAQFPEAYNACLKQQAPRLVTEMRAIIPSRTSLK